VSERRSDDGSRPERRSSAGRTALVLAGLFVVAVLHGRAIHAPCDDAYISYVYAKNLVEGNGLTFNGTVVWGFTSPLWVVLLALPGFAGLPVHVGGELLSALSAGFALWATYRLGRACRLGRSGAFVPPLLLAMTGDFALYSSVGLEQVLFVGLVALATSLAIEDVRRTWRRTTLLAVVLALTILTRPEGALVAVLLLSTWPVVGDRTPRAAPACGLLVAALLAPALVALRLTYGDWLPNTYYAKGNAGLENLPHGLAYLEASLVRHGPVAAGLVAALIATVVRGRASAHGRTVLLLAMAAAWLTSVTIQGGDNLLGGRMLIPALPLVYVALVDLAPRWSRRTATVATGIACVALPALWAADDGVREHAAMWHRNTIIRRNTGLTLRHHFPPDTVVALNAAGIVPYYSGLPTIDMLGLNDRHIARHGLRDRALRLGRQVGDGAYVLSREPDVILFGRAEAEYVSDREIRSSPEFRANYSRVEWRGRGPVFVRFGAQLRSP